MRGLADALLRNDSIKRATEQLFLEGAQFSPVQPIDSLQVVATPTTAADLFGAASSMVTSAPIHTPLPELSTNPLFQGFALLLMAIYLLFIFYHASDISTLFTRSSNELAGVSDIPGGSGYSHFLNIAGTIGSLATGLLCVKCIDLMLPRELLPYQAAAGVSLIATATLFIITALQVGVLYMIGVVTLSQRFIGELLFLRRMVYAITAIAATPMVIFFALSPGQNGAIWLYIIVGVVIITSVIYLQKSLSLFIHEKISILHWFLYLCTIEIFPISLLWLLIARQ